MMRLAAVLFFIFLISCSDRAGIPDGVLSTDSMQVVMKDMVIASQYSIENIARDSLQKDKVKANQELMERIFAIHHTDRQTFTKSMDFYESRPDLYKKIFDSLAAYASLHQKDLYNSKPAAPHFSPVPQHGPFPRKADSVSRRLHPVPHPPVRNQKAPVK